MSEHQSETAFLRQIILFENSDEGRKLEQKIAQVQREQRCVNRAAALVALLTALGLAAVGYGVFLQENFLYELDLVLRLISEFGLASLICLLGFLFLSLGRQRRLKELRAECRRLISRVVESRLSKPPGDPLPERPSSYAVPHFFRTGMQRKTAG